MATIDTAGMVEDLSGNIIYAANQEPVAEPRQSFLADVGDAYPGMFGAAAMKTFRGSRTISKGGWDTQNRVPSGIIRGGMSNLYTRPRKVGRFASQDYFHNPITPGGHAGLDAKSRAMRYTPFYAAAIPNSIGRAMTNQSTSSQMNRLFHDRSASNYLKGKGFVDRSSGEVVSRGFVSRIAASSKIGKMSADQTGAARRFLSGSVSSMGWDTERVIDAISNIEDMSPLELRQATAGSGAGGLSGKLGGFIASLDGPVSSKVYGTFGTSAMEGARTGGTWAYETGARNINTGRVTMRSAGGAAFRQLSERSASGFGKAAGLAGGVAVKGAARLAGPVGLAMLAYDVGRLTGSATSRIASDAVDATVSYIGTSQRGIMDQSFHDTEVTMTSRSRGVAAIQNSRLNARSILGSEAGAIANYFN